MSTTSQPQTTKVKSRRRFRLGRRVRTGIDLGTRSVKFVTIDCRARCGRVLAFGSAPVTPGPNGAPAAGAWRGAVDALLSRHRLRPGSLGRIALGIGGDSVTVRQFDLPGLSDEELASTMPLEARRHVPVAADTEIALSYQVLSRDEERGRLDVLLAACPRALVDDTVRAVEKAGLEPELVDAAPLAALNAMLYSEELMGEDVGFLDIGGVGSTLSLYRSGGFLLCRRIGVGGDALTAEIAERTGEPTERAEAIKRGDGGEPVPDAPSLIERSLGQLGDEVKRSIRFFDGKSGRRGLSSLHLGGGGALAPGLAAALERSLGLPVRRSNPAARLADSGALAGSDREGRDSVASELAVAVGLTRWWES